MHIEARSLNKAIYVIGQKIRDIARGHSLEDEARVIRIISGDPSSISPEDTEKYKQRRLDSLIPLGINMNPVSPVSANLAAFFEEQERQRRLTSEQLVEEVIEDAQRQAQEWRLLIKPVV